MPVERVTLPADLTTDAAQITALRAIESRYNALVDYVNSSSTGVPLLQGAETGGLLSPTQKNALTGGGNADSLHTHANVGAQDIVDAKLSLDHTGVGNVFAQLTALDTALAGAAGTFRFRRGTGNQYRLATNYTSPVNVLWQFDPGAMITVDGVVLTFLGMLDAPISKIFNCINGGKVRFYRQNVGADTVVAYILSVYTEWFGAFGDGDVHWITPNYYTADDFAFEMAAESIRGWPHTPLVTPSYFRGRIQLRPGATYIKARALEFVGGIGLSIVGGGRENTTIMYVGGGISATADSYPAANEVQLSGSLPPTLVGRWIVMAGPTHWSGAKEIIADLGGGRVRTWDNHGYTALAQTVYLLEEGIIDLNGIHDARLSDFSISLSDGGAIMSGLYYHRDANTSVRGSSKGGFLGIKVTGMRYAVAAIAAGSFDPGEYLHQEDLATFWHCEALGRYPDLTADDKKVWSLNGFRFGAAGIPSNPLNYTCHACVSTNFGNGIAVLATNVRWDGGTIQTNNNDIYLFQGAQCYVSVSGFRTEGSHRLCYGFSSGLVGYNIYLADIEFRGEELGRNVDTGTYDTIFLPWPGTAEINRIRAIWGPNTGSDGGGEGRDYTAIGTDGSGNGYLERTALGLTINDWVGENLEIWDVNDPIRFRPMTYEILSNTADRITVKGPWTTGSHGEMGVDWPALFPPAPGRRFLALRAQRIRITGSKTTNVTIRDYITGHRTLKQILPDLGVVGKAATTWNIDVMPFNVAGPEPQTGNPGPHRYGPRSDGFYDFGQASNMAGKPSLSWSQCAVGRIILDANYIIPLGGNAWAGDPVNYPRVWFPAPDTRMIVEATQDAIGGRTLTFDTTKPIKWVGGAPAAGVANSVRVYYIHYRGSDYLIKYEDYV